MLAQCLLPKSKLVLRDLPNLHQHLKCLRPLIKNDSIRIINMNKGNGCIIIDRNKYVDKMMKILSDSNKFVELSATTSAAHHPIIKYENKLQRMVRTIVKPKVNQQTYSRLYPSGGVPGKLYGAAKVHKDDTPLRPVVSMIGTPQYHLAKYLDQLIRPYVPNEHVLQSTYDLLEKLKHISELQHQNLYCVSFDVKNLFTNIPIKETIDIICANVTTQTNFPYSSSELRSLLNIANESIFNFDGKTYRQIDGISMGNPLAPILADYFMGHLEDKLFKQKHNFLPVKYYRYVDDTVCFFKHEDDVNKFLDLINALHNNVQFTCERSHNGTLPFLDIKLHIAEHNITTEIYRKDTYTGRLLHFKSVVPKIWKTGLIKTLVYRAYHLSSNWHYFHKEINTLQDILTYNGFPFWWLNRAVKSFLASLYTTEGNSDGSSNNTDDRNYIVIKLPFYGTSSITLKRKINHLLHRFHNQKIKLVFVARRLRTIFKVKDSTPKCLRSSVVYKFTCSEDPNATYVGETGRQLIRRIQDHVSSNTAVTEHLRTCSSCSAQQHDFTENFSIIGHATDSFERTIKEALLIKQLKPNLNTQCISGKNMYSLQLF